MKPRPDLNSLPESSDLPINILAACFNKTTATYKFYWLISIIQEIELGNTIIAKKDLFARMISNAWYTVNYFQVSFGKHDLIQNSIREITSLEQISIDEKQQLIFGKLSKSENSDTLKILEHYNRNVPHWFLSPWFPALKGENESQRRGRIYSESQNFNNDCLYALYEGSITINPIWAKYLKTAAGVIKGFCFWNLALFLQLKNPNVPDIPNKLIKAAKRNSLIRQKSQFWDLVLHETGSVKCIYTGKNLYKGDYALEHFIPYSFVSHDLIWNLIPADKSYNSSKGNKLPPLDLYFDSFSDLQEMAFDIIRRKSPNNKLLQDYLTIFPDQEQSFSRAKLRENIQPLITIASNNGFEFMK